MKFILFLYEVAIIWLVIQGLKFIFEPITVTDYLLVYGGAVLIWLGYEAVKVLSE